MQPGCMEPADELAMLQGLHEKAAQHMLMMEGSSSYLQMLAAHFRVVCRECQRVRKAVNEEGICS